MRRPLAWLALLALCTLTWVGVANAVAAEPGRPVAASSVAADAGPTDGVERPEPVTLDGAEQPTEQLMPGVSVRSSLPGLQVLVQRADVVAWTLVVALLVALVAVVARVAGPVRGPASWRLPRLQVSVSAAPHRGPPQSWRPVLGC